MEPEGSLPHSQEPVICPYAKPEQVSYQQFEFFISSICATWPSKPILRFRLIVAKPTRRRQRFSARPVHQNFVVDKVALWQGFLQVLRFSPITIIPPLLHIHSFTHHPRNIMFLSPVTIIPPMLHTHSFTYLTYSMEQSPSWEANWFCS